MRAAVCRAFRAPLQIEDVELRPPGAGEVSVRVAACAICHSDVAFMQGAWGGELPAIYGHEAAGVVDGVGAGVRSVADGDHVVVTPIRACGRCDLCLGGQPALCEALATHPLTVDSPLRTAGGDPIHQGIRTAAFAERVTVDASQVVPIARDVPLESACLLACGVITGVGAVTHTARVELGSTVAVIGAGGVGLNAVQGAVLAGARIVAAIDLIDARLEAATRLGATYTLNPQREDLERQAGIVTEGNGFDYVFVATAAAAAAEQGMRLLRRAGALVLLGIPPTGETAALDVSVIADGSLRILGSKLGGAQPQRDIPALVELYRSGRLKLDELVSGPYRLEDINEAVAAAHGGAAFRPVIAFG
jgi:S-(hydroxymethyl)glutathione dehydrogenase/alcohol dehydrogenase